MLNATECKFFDDFLGVQTALAVGSNAGTPWAVADTSSAGTPTYTGVASEKTGAIKLLCSSTSEAQNVCLYWGDILGLCWDNVQRITFRLKVGAAITTAEQLTFGLWSARNDTVDSVAYNAHFTCHAAATVDCETDDATTDTDDKSTGISLGTTYKDFQIDLSNGLSDVRFLMSDANGNFNRVCAKTTFNIAQATGTYCQPAIQLQKASGSTTPSVSVDYVEIEYKR